MVFISYAAEDRSVADAVCGLLESAGMRCWMAPRDVAPGTAYAASIVEAIAGSAAFVLVLSPHSNRSPQVLRELERAVSRDVPVLPLRIAEFPLSPEMEYFVSSRHWLDALTLPLEPHLARLLYGVRAVLDGAPVGGWPGGARPATAPGPPSEWNLKHYVYISDAKVDMALAQLPAATRRALATRLELPAGLLVAGSPGARDLGERVARLHAAVEAVRVGARVGTVDEPADYFAGTMPMCWGPYAEYATSLGLVYFGGTTERTTLGLGGSMKHVVGEVGWVDTHSHSVTHVLLGVLQKELRRELPAAGAERPRHRADPTQALMAVSVATHNLNGPEQRLEFLAKRLLSGADPYGEHGQTLLGTPLYVALAE